MFSCWGVPVPYLELFWVLPVKKNHPVNIHQIRLISLFLTPFDHFHFHGSAGLVPKLILTPCHIPYMLIPFLHKNTKNLHTIDAIAAIFEIIHTFTINLQNFFNTSYNTLDTPVLTFMTFFTFLTLLSSNDHQAVNH